MKITFWIVIAPPNKMNLCLTWQIFFSFHVLSNAVVFYFTEKQKTDPSLSIDLLLFLELLYISISLD